MSSSEDKCEVSYDKYEDRRKIKYFRKVINSTSGRKGKNKTASRGVYKDIEVEEAEGRNFSTQNKSLALREFRHFSVFCYRAATQLDFCSLRLLQLGISPTALVAEALTLL